MFLQGGKLDTTKSNYKISKKYLTYFPQNLQKETLDSLMAHKQKRQTQDPAKAKKGQKPNSRNK